MVNKKYVIEAAQANQMRAFKVFDGRLNVVHFSDKPTSPAEKLEELKSFMDNASGLYKIQLRNQAGLGDHPRQKQFQDSFIGEYEVMLERTEPRRMSGLDVLSGVPSHEMIRQYEREIRDLHGDKIRLEAEIGRLKDKIERIEEAHKAEVNQIKSADNKIAGLLGQFSNVLNPQSMVNKVNGIGNNTVNEPPKSDKKTRIIKAMNRLMELDPNFVENMEKLVELKENRPDTYDMAVSMLNNM